MITVLSGGDLGGVEDTSDWAIDEVKDFTTEDGRVVQYRKDTDNHATFIGCA